MRFATTPENYWNIDLQNQSLRTFSDRRSSNTPSAFTDFESKASILAKKSNNALELPQANYGYRVSILEEPDSDNMDYSGSQDLGQYMN